MRVLIVAIGTLGDVLPFISLGCGLQSVGYEVCINSHTIYKKEIINQGLQFVPLRGNPIEIATQASGERWLKSHNNPISFTKGLIKSIKPFMHIIMVDCFKACRDADAIITSDFGMFYSNSIAEKLNIPLILAYLRPINRSKYIRNSLLPIDLDTNNQTIIKFSHILFEQLFWQFSRKIVNRMREVILNLPKISIIGPFNNMHKGQYPILYGYSPTVLPKSPDWGKFIHVTGYWFPKLPLNWKPEPTLVDFIESGAHPIYFGLGSMNYALQNTCLNLFYEVLNLTKQRGIIQTGWTGKNNRHTHDFLQINEYIPHDWLFPKMSVVIHHGGAGTSAAGLRAGIPTITVPFTADQPFWGKSIFNIGAGAKPIPYKKLTPKILAEAINGCISNERMRKRGKDLSKIINQEDGVTTAVNIIQRFLKQ